MAKGAQVTEEDLQAGLKSLGGLGAVAGSGGRRDSPFGNNYVKRPTAEISPTIVEPAKVEEPTKTIELKNKVESSVENVSDKVVARAEVESKQIEEVKPKIVEVQPKLKVRQERTPIAPSTKTDVLTERITLQMSPEMRDELNDVARKLQRAKTDKTVRITANCVMRAAIQAVLDEVDLFSGEGVNSEDELLLKLKKRIKTGLAR